MPKKKLKVIPALFIFVFFLSYVQAEEVPTPTKVEVDTNFDGVVDRVEHYDGKGKISQVESDTDSDGVYDEWVYYKNGKVIRAEKDTNGDGKPDTWMEY